MIRTAARLGILELRHKILEVVLMAGALAVALMAVLVVDAFDGALASRYAVDAQGLLVAFASGTMGEVQGSRLPVDVGDQLLAGGAGFALPEIRTIVGTSAGDARFVRGVPLDGYDDVESFRMIAGRPLAPGDSPRMAMVGVGLAERDGLDLGGSTTLRGRDFTVVGIFAVDTYSDFETWIPLPAAQELMGWGSDVSVFVLPAGSGWQAGDTLPSGVLISPNGQTAKAVLAEWEPLLDLMRLIIAVLAFSTTTALASMIWRLAWLRRRQLAVLRSLGYRAGALAAYLLTQTGAVTGLALLLGIGGAVAFAAAVSIQGIGMSVEPSIRPDTVLSGFVVAAVIAVTATLLPAWSLARSNLQELLRQES